MSLESLDGHTTLITVNRRLSRVLRDAYDRSRVAAGARVWESPDILPYTSWLQRTWNDFVAGTDTPLPALLSADQDLSLWEQSVARQAGAELPLLQSAEAARNAQAAWTLLRAWHLRPDGELGYANDEVRAFRGWARHYVSLREEGGWVDLASVADMLAEGLATAHLGETRRLLLAGLDTPTPQQQTLFSALTAIGVAVERWQPPSRDTVPIRYELPDQDAELEAAARWARRRVEEGAPGPVGIVVPGLAAARHRVAAIFEDVFTPGAPRPGAPEPAPAFNISLGRPLAEVPVVGDALLALGALEGQLSLSDAGRWLLSPYLGGGAPGWRARFDAHLRRIGEPRYQLARLQELARSMDEPESMEASPDPSPDASTTTSAEAPLIGAGGAEAFAALLDRLGGHGASEPGRRDVSAWAAHFSSWLRDAGWPGDRTLASDEFQAVQAFRELLASLAALTPVLPPVDCGEALAELRRLATGQVFQPRSGSAAVQILGVLEAACIDYSHLWVTGLHDRAWPEPPRPNPFLPVALQRELGMPRAGSEQQLRWARDWTARMLSSAGEVVVSNPRQQGDESLRVSDLIGAVHIGADDSLSLSTVPRDVRSVQDAAPEMEVIQDDRAPPVDESRRVRGGVSVFKDQAACPFRAFAVHRLETSDVTAPESSLDPRVRGNLAHRLMELLWQSLGGQSRMLAMGAEERAELIRSTARRVLAEEARRRPDTLRGRLLAIEQTRLESLAEAWLAIDAGRSPFEVETEHSESRTVAGLPVTLRPDRIDRLEGGQLLLVDYKTGQCNPRDWFGERPDEPQLPVYALAMDDMGEGRVAGLAFGVLRPGELGYRGLGEGAPAAGGQLAPGVGDVTTSRTGGAREATDWEAHKSLWRERLARIARAYLEGDARVDPKDAGATCRYCGLQPLCRIHDR
jgi:probable DNA repair protein